MFKLIDKTLTNPLPKPILDCSKVARFCQELVAIGVDLIEISPENYRLIADCQSDCIKDLPWMIRLDYEGQLQDYPDIGSAVSCRFSEDRDSNLQIDYPIRERKEVQTLLKRCPNGSIRITGLGDLAQDYYMTIMSELLDVFSPKNIAFCPDDRTKCANALAVEWLLGKGRWAVTSFNGHGGWAATEIILVALRVIARQRPNASLKALSNLRELYEEIFKVNVSDKAPVIGRRIFEVEAGIHAAAMNRGTHIYEPYQPDITGNQRRLVVGKHSGKKAILIKLSEMGIDLDEQQIPLLLERVQIKSLNLQRSLVDCEFVHLASEVKAYD